MKKKMLALLLASMMLLSACGAPAAEAETPAQSTQEQPDESAPADTAQKDATESDTSSANAEQPDAEPLKIVGMKGATTMGMAYLNDVSDNTYDVQMVTAADEVMPLLVQGKVDIALVPSNLAATLYAKTEQGISVINLNTLNVLACVGGAEAAPASDITDLAGRTVYMTGKGATPEATVRKLLETAAVQDVTLEFKSEPTEIVAALAADPTAVAVVPQPFATVAVIQNEGASTLFTLEDAWATHITDGSQIVTGVTVVRNAVLESNPEAVNLYLADAATSAERVNADPEAAGAVIEEMGIVAAAVATKAIPESGITSVTGAEMQTILSGYLQALYDFNPQMIGGTLPDEGFYYLP